MTSGTNPPPDTIRLTSVAAEWSEHEHTNPRRLASEVAALLRTLPPTQLLDHRIVTPALFDPVTGPGGFTAAALADYFEGVSQGTPPLTIRTSTGTAPAGAVLIARSWINQVTKEAAQRAAFVAGLVLIANDGDSLSIIVGGTSSASSAPATPPSGNEPGYLKMRQAQQRKDGERGAGERLEAAELRAFALEQENTKLRAQLASLERHHQQAINESEEHRRAAMDECRRRTLGEEHRRELAEAIEIAEAKTAKAEAALEQAAAQAAMAFPALSQQLIEVARLFNPPADTTNKPLDSRERATFERLLYVLAREAKYQLQKPYADEGLIVLYADTIGAKVPTGKGLIAKKLEAAIARFAQDQNE